MKYSKESKNIHIYIKMANKKVICLLKIIIKLLKIINDN